MIIYINSEDIKTFLFSNIEKSTGVSYEWEGEDVIQIHLQPQKHSYGSEDKVLFCKEHPSDEENKEFRFIVVPQADNEGCILYENVNGSLKQRVPSFIPSKQDLYSRNNGLLEVGLLEQKCVLIIGLGSFGSQIAIELAKAGVGNFSIMDFDRIELHNLCRHTSYLNDLGRLKTNVIEEAILGKNPYAQVKKYPVNINEDLDLLEKQVANADIIICATDNNASRYHISEALVRNQKIGVFGRAITRAEGGDVFIYRPGEACYCCLTNLIKLPEEEITNVRDSRIPQYADNPNAMVQVGLSADIEPICNMMIKLTLMELSRGMTSGISSLEDDFVYNYYIWANRRERNYSRWPAMPEAGSRPTVMRWYGARIKKNEHCTVCTNDAILYEGPSVKIEGLEDISLDHLEENAE